MTGRLRRLLGADTEAEPSRAAADARVAARLERLEQMVEGVQDTMYRQAQRTDEELAELRRRLEPAEVAKSLSEDARRRGL